MNIYLFSKLINGKELSKPKSKGRNHKGKIDLIIKIFKHLCVKEKKKPNISIPLFGYPILCGSQWVQPLISNLVFELSVLTLTLAPLGAMPQARRPGLCPHGHPGRQGQGIKLKVHHPPW